MAELKILIPRVELAKRIGEMGAEISRDFAGQPVTLVGVLKGAAIFLADLARVITLDATFDFVGVSSYGSTPVTAKDAPAWDSMGTARLTKDVDCAVENRNVILIEDILDSGLTLNYLKELFESRRPRALRIAVLLDKPERRKQPIRADYTGFRIPNEYVVGYGLDYGEKYRNLPDICSIGQGQ